MDPSNRYIWRERTPRWVAFTTAIALFPPICAAFFYPLMLLFGELIGHDPRAIGAATLVAATFAYCVARLVYPHIRWKRVRCTSCVHCDYDLTGNTSGICPECGTPIDGVDVQ